MVLQVKEQASDASIHEIIKDVIKLSELLKDVAVLYSSGNSVEKEKIVRMIFSELSISGNTLKYKCKNSFQALESRFVALGAPCRTRTCDIFSVNEALYQLS